jgi:hypothetical protein
MLIPPHLSMAVQRRLPGWLLRPLKAAYAPLFIRSTQRIIRRQHELLTELVPTQPCKVLGGPFRGITYVDRSVGSQLIPKIVGSYEGGSGHLRERIETVLRARHECKLRERMQPGSIEACSLASRCLNMASRPRPKSFAAAI